MICLVFFKKFRFKSSTFLCTKWNFLIDMDQGFFLLFFRFFFLFVKVSWYYKIASWLWQKNCLLPKPGYYFNNVIWFSCHSILWETSVSSLWLTTESKYQFTSKEICTEPQTRTLQVKHSDPTVLSQAVILQQQGRAHVSEQVIPEYLISVSL